MKLHCLNNLLTKTNLFSILAYIDGERRWQTLLLSALYVCGRHGKHQKSFQRLSRHHSKNASAAIRAVIGKGLIQSVGLSVKGYASPSKAFDGNAWYHFECFDLIDETLSFQIYLTISMQPGRLILVVSTVKISNLAKLY